MDVTAIGRTEILYNAIEAVRAAGHDIARIVTCDVGEFYRVTPADFEVLAEAIGADFVCTENINDPEMVALMAESESDVAISANWKYPLERGALDAFEHGVLNAHAGDLPQYRGNAAPNWAIMNGEEDVVLTVHRMVEDLDAGPILCQHSVPLTKTTYLEDVYEAMWSVFPDLFVEAVDGLADGTLTPRPQSDDPSEVLRGFPRVPIDSRLDWTRPAVELDRLVRASAEPLFGAFTYLGSERLRVWRAHAESPAYGFLGSPGQVAERRPETGEVAVIAGEDFLVLESVEPERDERGPASEVITGIRTRLGMDEQARIHELERRLSELEDRGRRSD